MDVVHPRCAGIDIGKRSVSVCVRVAGKGRQEATKTVTTWPATTVSLLLLRDYLIAQQVTAVAMEATGDFWKPVYYVLEDAGFELIMANARMVKNIPGRKSDVNDSTWLAELAAHGLIRSSFVPPPPIRELRDLTRARTTLTRERGRAVQRLESVLEDAGIKLGGVASNLTGVSSLSMIQAMIEGERDPAILANLAQAGLRRKIPELTAALTGRFDDHHGFMAKIYLDAIAHYDDQIEQLSTRIEAVIGPFRWFTDLIRTIPGVGERTAQVITAETGADMSVFASAAHLASWAGVCPGHNESAGRVKATHTRHGNPYLKGALGIVALAITHTKGSHLAAKYRRLAGRIGAKKALVAIEHTVIVTIWHMGTNRTAFTDLGPDYYARHHSPERAREQAVDMLKRLGFNVQLTAA
jgi:transposase